ncbi:ABC transporter permease [Mesorhizobium loti]|uniref:ABC transporter permease n=1 Tax=Rhizobium loti TaxID=381 RepID=UPI00319E1ED5
MHWLGGLLTGDLGHSLANGRAVSQLIGERLGNTLFLAGVAACFSVPVSLLLGLLTALYRGSVFDRFTNAVTLTWISFPEFFVAYILIMFFSVQAGWFPSLSTMREGDSFTHSLYLVTLPALTLTLVVTAHMMRMTRAAIISVLGSPFIEMAKLKGIGQRRVIVWHALPNALAPIINVVVIDLAYLIVGVVVVEVVFGLSRTRAVDDRLRSASRYYGRSSLQPNLCSHLRFAEHVRRRVGDCDQSEAYVPQMSTPADHSPPLNISPADRPHRQDPSRFRALLEGLRQAPVSAPMGISPHYCPPLPSPF